MKTLIIKSKDREMLSLAVNVVKKGGVIIYPSESSYGIGADASNSKAIRKILKIKGRANKPISIIVSSIKMARGYAYLDKGSLDLMKRLMPGRLTLVVKKKNLPDILSKHTIGFRIPPHKFSLLLLKEFGKPITATSANKSGEPVLYKISDVIKEFSGSVDLIIDAGDLRKRKPSTVFDLANKKILREGPVKGKDIMNALMLNKLE